MMRLLLLDIIVRRSTLTVVLLCVVRWVHGNADAKPYSAVDVSLIESAVYWHDYKTADMAVAALAKRDAAAPTASAS